MIGEQMKIRSWILIILLIPSISLAAERLTLGLEEAIELGLKQNRTLRIARERVQASEYGVRSARTAFLPHLSGGGPRIAHPGPSLLRRFPYHA